MSYILRKSLLSSMKIIKDYVKSSSISRTLTTSKILTDNYEGDGKTTVTILNREYTHLILIDTLSTYGFRLNNGIFAAGPLAAFPRTILQWNVNSIAELTKESLSLFCLMEPKLDILVLGTGSKKIRPSKDILQYLASNKISVEILPTFQACAIFNFLNTEGRCIAGAFIPPEYVPVYAEETLLINEVEALDEYHVQEHPKIYK